MRAVRLCLQAMDQKARLPGLSCSLVLICPGEGYFNNLCDSPFLPLPLSFLTSGSFSRTFLSHTLSWTRKSNGPRATGASPALLCSQIISRDFCFSFPFIFLLPSSFPLPLLPPSPLLPPFPSVGSSPVSSSQLAAPSPNVCPRELLFFNPQKSFQSH